MAKGRRVRDKRPVVTKDAKNFQRSPKHDHTKLESTDSEKEDDAKDTSIKKISVDDEKEESDACNSVMLVHEEPKTLPPCKTRGINRFQTRSSEESIF